MNEIVESARNVYSKEMYAMYLRKSRADIELEAMGEGETLARHKAMLETLAAKYDIHPNQIVIYQEVVSGESIDDRPKMQQLLSDVYAKKYKGVLVVEVERLARGNTKDQGEVADAFQFSDTKIITPSKVYDPNDEYDQEYFEFGLFMSRREYKTIRRRLVSGKWQSVKEGNYLPPQRIFGFDVKRFSKKDRRLIENKNESPIVQMIFDWFTEEGRSYQWIANELKRMGIQTSAGNNDWHRYTVRDMLRNVHYIGKVRWGRSKKTKVFDEATGKLIKKTVLDDSAEEVYEGKHDGIISEEQFNKAAAIMQANKRPSIKVNEVLRNPYAGIIKCCDCGRHMGYENYNDGSRVPRIVHTKNTICKKKSVAFDVVSDAIVNALKLQISDFEFKMEHEVNNKDLEQHQIVLQSMEAELAKLEKKKQRLFDSWEADDGMYTRDEFIERKQMYTSSIETLKEQIKEAKQNIPEPVNYQEQIATIHSLIDCIQDDTIDAETKNVSLKRFIDKITFDVIDHGVRRGATPILEVFLK